MVKLNKIRHILAAVIVLSCAALTAVIVIRLTRSKGPEEKLPRLPEHVDISLKKIHYSETKHGVKRWDLYADQVDFDQQQAQAHLTSIRMVFAEGGGFGQIVLKADRADYNHATGDVRLAGHVVAQSASGMAFTTGRAAYNGSRYMLVSDDRVRYTDHGCSLEGVGMELSLRTRNLKMAGGVTARYWQGARR